MGLNIDMRGKIRFSRWLMAATVLAVAEYTGATLLENIDHVAKVAGEDHVSIGTDGGVLPLVIDAKAREDARKDYEQRKAAGFPNNYLPAWGRSDG